MEDCWLENEKFDFDIPLSPLFGDGPDEKEVGNNDENIDEDSDDEIFFGPVGHLERCAAAVVQKNTVEPVKPLEPKEQVMLLQECAKVSAMLKYKPLTSFNSSSPVAVVPPFKRNSSGINLLSLKSAREKMSNKENIENFGNLSVSKDTSKIEDKPKLHVPEKLKNSLNETQSKEKKPIRRLSCESGIARRSSSRIALPVATGIPKMQPKGLKPTGVPLLKPGLLQAKARPRTTATQESKLKPMKATGLETKSVSCLEASNSKAKVNERTKSVSGALPSRLFTTPKKAGEHRRSLSSTTERQTPRRQSNLNSSISKLPFTRPSHNSTPIRPVSAQTPNSRRSIGQGIPRPKSRLSVSGILKPSQDKSLISAPRAKFSETPKSIAKSRKSISKDEIRKSEKEATLLNEKSPTKVALISMPSPISNKTKKPLPDDVPAPVVDYFSNEEKPEQNSFKTDLLVPEVSMVQRSPLLKLDSPVAENPFCDPFATGSTPPVAPLSAGILEPEQVETNLIQF
ncbi:G2 and S phase-expressed protein 1-like [Rhopilema esculentum]|uniref:G2 and S phase-expressed protein 1-like n=1 Tax=Rhopilema esculentum TaxID=499914 RepID=UPI0031D4C92E